MNISDSMCHNKQPLAVTSPYARGIAISSKLRFGLIFSLMSAAALLASTPAHAAYTNAYNCGQFRVVIEANPDTNRYVYRSNGLTLTNGTSESLGEAGVLYTFRNRNYTYTVQDRADKTGELEVTESLPDGGQDLEVRQECSVQYNGR